MYNNDVMTPERMFHAGQLVGAGTYQLLGSQCLVYLNHTDYLPASFDGRVATYVLAAPYYDSQMDSVADVPMTWATHKARQLSHK